MSSADIVPIAIVLDEKTGYTLWAPPWEEDGEEWQAFLGAEDKILLFESPAHLAQYIREGDENDLSDHPEWDEVTELEVSELSPEEEHLFDLDGVYDLAARAPDRWSVTELADALDMVARFSECCDDAIVEPLTDIPEIGMLDQGADVFVGRTGEKAWDRVGMTIASEWETVCRRLSAYLDWRDPEDLDEDLQAAQEEFVRSQRPVEDPDKALATAEADVADDDELEDDELDDELDDEQDDEQDDEELDDESDLEADEHDVVDEADDEDEAVLVDGDDDGDDDDELDSDDTDTDEPGDDEAALVDDEADEPEDDEVAVADDEAEELDDTDDEPDEEADLPTAVLARSDAAGRDLADPEAFAFWEATGILPIHLVLPPDRFGFVEGFTLRCYLDDQPVFFGAERSAWVFRTPDALLDVVDEPEEAGLDEDHDLSGLATWDEVIAGVRDDDQPVAVSEEDDADVLAVDEMVHGRQDPDATTIARVADVLADLAEYAELDDVLRIMDGDGPVGTVLTAAREGATVRIPVGGEAEGLVSAWEAMLDELAGVLTWVE